MFKNTNRINIGSINSIPISSGIEYILSFIENPNPIEIESTFKNRFGQEQKIKRVRFGSCLLDDFKVVKKTKVNPKTLDVLSNIEINKVYSLDTSKTISNLLMDLIDKLEINRNEKFSFEQIETDNEFKPELKVKKIKI